MSISSEFTFEVEDVNNTIRKTNTLLRGLNNIRNLVNDLEGLSKEPTFAKLFWTLIQISRTYSGLKRIWGILNAETKVAAALMGIISPPTPPPKGGGGGGVIPGLDLEFNVRIEAFMNKTPMRLEGIDLTNLPEELEEQLRLVLYDDAEQTVADAQTSLARQAKSWTGNLASSIYWQPESYGTRILANANYAYWVEEGHKIVNPKPRGDMPRVSRGDMFQGYHYMREATDLARQRLPSKITDMVNALILQDV